MFRKQNISFPLMVRSWRKAAGRWCALITLSGCILLGGTLSQQMHLHQDKLGTGLWFCVVLV